MKTGIFFLALTFCAFTLSAQTNAGCDTIYTVAEVMPYYGDGVDEGAMLKAFLFYSTKHLDPILISCMQESGEVIASLHIVFAIDNKGNVIQVDITRPELDKNCEDKLSRELLAMAGWKPATMNGQAVCC